MKCLASLPNLSGGTSVEAVDAASLCAVVSGAGASPESSPFVVPLVLPSGSVVVSPWTEPAFHHSQYLLSNRKNIYGIK